MDWHTTGSREELLIVLRGRVRIYTAKAQRRGAKGAKISLRTLRDPAVILRFASFAMMRVGQGALLARRTPHCVVNRSGRPARYLYVTG